jgi:chromosome segregation ATPase
MTGNVKGIAICLSITRKERDELKQQNEVLLKRIRNMQQEEQALKEAVRYWGNRAEEVERKNKTLKQEYKKKEQVLNQYKVLVNKYHALLNPDDCNPNDCEDCLVYGQCLQPFIRR